MSTLHDIQSVRNKCDGLESGKITERKKAVGDLKALLSNSRIIAAINDNSQPPKCQERNALTWNCVFKHSEMYFLKEMARVDAIVRGKSSVSSAVLSNRSQLRRSAVQLPKLVLNKASMSGVLYVCPQDVIHFIFILLDKKSESMIMNFAHDAMVLLQQFFFKYPQYYNAASPQHWKDIVNSLIFLHDNHSNHSSFGRSVPLQCLELALRCIPYCSPRRTLYTAPLRPFIHFLERTALPTPNKPRSEFMSIVDEWLRIILTLIHVTGCEWRDVLCRLFEKTLPEVIHVWENRTSKRQCLLLHYLNAVVALHHPHHGGRSPRQSYLVHDEDSWTDFLQQLYSLLVESLCCSHWRKSRINSIMKSSVGSTQQQIIQNDSFDELSDLESRLSVVLTARVCCILFTDSCNDQSFVLSSNSNAITTTCSGRSSSKRSRLDTTLVSVLALVRLDGPAMTKSILWYDVLDCLLSQHVHFWTIPTCKLLLQTLLPLLETARALYSIEVLMRVLCNLCHVWAQLLSLVGQNKSMYDDENDSNIQQIWGLWSKVWSNCLRRVQGRQIVVGGLKLLHSLLVAGLEEDIMKLCQVLCRESIDCIIWLKESLLIIEYLIIYRKLPTKLKVVDDALGSDSYQPSSMVLLKALLPSSFSSQTSGKLHMQPICQHPQLLCKILLMLCSHNNNFLPYVCAEDDVQQIPLDGHYFAMDIPTDTVNWKRTLLHLSDIERLYIVASLASEHPVASRNNLFSESSRFCHGSSRNICSHEFTGPDHLLSGTKQTSLFKWLNVTEVVDQVSELYPCSSDTSATAVSVTCEQLQFDDRNLGELHNLLLACTEAALEGSNDELLPDVTVASTVVETMFPSSAVQDKKQRAEFFFKTAIVLYCIASQSTALANSDLGKLSGMLDHCVVSGCNILIQLLQSSAWHQANSLLNTLTALCQCPVPLADNVSPHCVSVLVCSFPPELGEALRTLIKGRLEALCLSNASVALKRECESNSTQLSSVNLTFGFGNGNLGSDSEEVAISSTSSCQDASLSDYDSDDGIPRSLSSCNELEEQLSTNGLDWSFASYSNAMPLLSPQDQCISAANAFLMAYYALLLEHENCTDQSPLNRDSSSEFNRSSSLKQTSLTPLFETRLLDQTYDVVIEIVEKYQELSGSFARYTINNVNYSSDFVRLSGNVIVPFCLDYVKQMLNVVTPKAKDILLDGFQVLGSLLSYTRHIQAVVASGLRLIIGMISWGGRNLDSLRQNIMYVLQNLTSLWTSAEFGEEILALIGFAIKRLSLVDPLETWSTINDESSNSVVDVTYTMSSVYNRLRMFTSLNTSYLFVNFAGNCVSSETVNGNCESKNTNNCLMENYVFYYQCHSLCSPSVHCIDEYKQFLSNNFTYSKTASGEHPSKVKPVFPLPGKHQIKKFKRLCTAAIQALQVENDIPEEFLVDEHNNRISCLLLAHICTAAYSEHVRASAVYAMLHAIYQHHVNENLVRVALERLSLWLQSSSKEILLKNIELILEYWFIDKLPLQRFPYGLLGGEDYSILLQFCGPHLLYLLLLYDKNSIVPLATLVNMSESELLQEHFCELLARLAPAAVQAKGNYPEALDKFDTWSLATHAAAFNALGTSVRDKLALPEYLGRIIKSLLRLSHFPGELYHGELLPLRPKPVYSPRQVLYTLDCLGELLMLTEPVLTVLLSSGQQLLEAALSVQFQLSSAVDAAAAREAIASVAVFVPLLLAELTSDSAALDKVSYFIVAYTRELLTSQMHRLCFLSEHLTAQLAMLVVETLRVLCSSSVLSEHLTESVPIICERLRVMCCDQLPGWEACLPALHFLTKSQHKELRYVMAQLPPLFTAKDCALVNLKKINPGAKNALLLQAVKDEHDSLLIATGRQLGRLSEEIKHFLKVSYTGTEAWTLQYLTHLVSDCDCKELAEVKASGLSLALFKRLSAICRRTDVSLNIKKMSAQILGHLSISVDPSMSDFVSEMPWNKWIDSKYVSNLVEDVALIRVALVVGGLADRLFSNDNNLCRAASSALMSVVRQSKLLPKMLKHFSLRVVDTLELFKSTFISCGAETVACNLDGRFSLNSCYWKASDTFSSWIIKLVENLLPECGFECPELSACKSVCALDSSFCCLLLPYIVHAALEQSLNCSQTGRASGKRTTLPNIFSLRETLSKLFEATLKEWKCSLNSSKVIANKSTWQQKMHDETPKDLINVTCALLNCLEHLWTLPPPHSLTDLPSVTARDRCYWMTVPPTVVAEAALWTGRDHLALVWLEEHFENYSSDGVFRNLLVDAYSALCDSPSVQACGVTTTPSSPQRARVCRHSNQSLLSLAISDSASLNLRVDPGATGGSISSLVESLQSSGLYTTLACLANAWTESNVSDAVHCEDVLREARCECAWRLGRWEQTQSSTDDSAAGFHGNIFKALSCLQKYEHDKVLQIISTARENLLDKFCNWHNGSLSKLRVLSDIELVCCNSEVALKRWDDSSFGCDDLYVNVDEELVLAVRTAVLQQLIKIGHLPHTGDWLQRCALLSRILVHRSVLGRNGTKPGICESSLQLACRLLLDLRVTEKTAHVELCAAEINLEKAKVAVCFGQLQQAQLYSEQLLRSLDHKLSDIHAHLYCEALLLLAHVLLETKAVPAQKILENQHQVVIGILETSRNEKSSKLLYSSHLQVANVSDQLYRDTEQFLSSEEVTSRRNNIRKNFDNAKLVEQLLLNTSDTTIKNGLRRTMIVLTKNAQLDEQNLKELEEQKKFYLLQAMKHYLICLGHSTNDDLPAYKIVSLWFDNSRDSSVSEIILDSWPNIKSFKFVPLLHQLIAKASCSNSAFSKTLNVVLRDICIQHPHHGLPILLKMAHAHFDDIVRASNPSSRVTCRKSQTQLEEDRVQAAKRVVSQLKSNDVVMCSHLCEMEKICQAYLHLANYDSWSRQEEASQQINIPRNQPILNIPEPKYVAPLTQPILVQANCRYEVPLLRSWHKIMNLVGGVNKPKRLTVCLSNGQTFHELLKGKDDLRQDAVLEQVFEAVNVLLRRDKETFRQQLAVQTYVVVPLSQATGLVQWCDNAESLGDCLIGTGTKNSKALHQRYRPHDLSSKECMSMVDKASTGSFAKKREVFENILKNFKPVMRFLFHEIASSPEQFYSLRQGYTKSLATSCAAGYILGLGDRHPHNILLHKKTAQVIQIDLGIAFDTAKILPTPETVPFRLTQNIVDGLGPSGVNGGFRTGLQSTLRVMREARLLLNTVVGVLRHDPLQQWQLSPRQMAQLQQADRDEKDGSSSGHVSVDSTLMEGTDNEGTSGLADRSLRRVYERLSGVVDGTAMTVPEQVTSLIQQATDIDNLCALYRGWQAYI